MSSLKNNNNDDNDKKFPYLSKRSKTASGASDDPAAAAACSTQPRFASTLDGLFSSTNYDDNDLVFQPQQQSSTSGWNLWTMPSFSASAAIGNTTTTPPVAAAAAMAAAAASSSEKQQLQVEEDLGQLPALRDRIRGYVDLVVRTDFPKEESNAYLEALGKAPSVVQNETDPLQFVRYCDYDLRKGAKRLCLYWTERKALFGPERAFLPLTLTGTGALTDQDVLSIHAGFPALLPPLGLRSVLMVDSRHILPGSTLENLQRCVFYVFKRLAQNDLSQVGDGVLTLYPLSTPKLQQSNDIGSRFRDCKVMKLCAHVFPVKMDIRSFNIPGQNRGHLIQDVMNSAREALGEQFGPSRVHVHVKSKMTEIFQLLRALGLTKTNIPLAFGGDWKQELMYKWCQEQKKIERETYKHLLLPESPKNPNAPLDGSVAKLEGLLLSRRKRDRSRERVAALYEKSDHLNEEHERLVKEHHRLEELLQQAQEMLKQQQPNQQNHGQ